MRQLLYKLIILYILKISSLNFLLLSLLLLFFLRIKLSYWQFSKKLNYSKSSNKILSFWVGLLAENVESSKQFLFKTFFRTSFQIICTCYRLTVSFLELFWDLKNCIKSSQSELYSGLPFKEYCRIALENEKTIQNYKKIQNYTKMSAQDINSSKVAALRSSSYSKTGEPWLVNKKK